MEQAKVHPPASLALPLLASLALVTKLHSETLSRSHCSKVIDERPVSVSVLLLDRVLRRVLLEDGEEPLAGSEVPRLPQSSFRAIFSTSGLTGKAGTEAILRRADIAGEVDLI
jgi:hypothetical protein